MHNNRTITIVGAGASGCFCAAQLHEALPGADIRIMEAGPRPMAKLAVTGGGRCNISNTFEQVRSLEEVYPRGSRLMKRALAEFSPEMLLDWFRKRGVNFVTEEGGRIFPASQDAGEIVRTLLGALDGVRIECNTRVENPGDSAFTVITTGGGKGMDILKNLPVEIVQPVPSLFTFNLSDSQQGGRSRLCSLMGTSSEAVLSVPGTSFRSEGDLLVTDWGLSGPAALRLSSHAARHLADCGYKSPLQIRWINLPEDGLRAVINDVKTANLRKMLKSAHPEGISSRLWEYLLDRAGIREGMVWAELGSKGLNRLVQTILADNYYISGKTRFRDEFVSCGGVSLFSVNLKSLECKERAGLFFAGEVLDVDAVTGGFNLQAAWSTAHIVAKTIINRYDTQDF